MATYELSTNDHGYLAEVIAGRYVDFPTPLEDTINNHLRETYAVPSDGWDSIALRSRDRHLTGEFHFGMLDDIELPDDDSWGYSKGWIPDDVIKAVARQERGGNTELSKFMTDEVESEKSPVRAYYPVEVKSVTSGNRVRITENQQQKLQSVSKDLDRVHPVIVTVDLNGLPETADVTAEMYEESVWADGQITKTIK